MVDVQIPGSKSITNRALFLAAAAHGVTRLRRPLHSDDSLAFVQVLRQLGYAITEQAPDWIITGRPQGPGPYPGVLDCRDGATTSRFLPALAAAGQGSWTFDASAQMRARPMKPLTDALAQLGVKIDFLAGVDHHPFTLTSHEVAGGTIALDAGVSSQFLSALLLLGPLTQQGLRIEVTDLVSAPYVAITTAMMASFGVQVNESGSTYQVPAMAYQACDYLIEPDASSASYLFAAAALTGRSVRVPGLGSRSRQGDLGFVQILAQMGAQVEITEQATTVTGTGRLGGITVDMRDISDTMPTLAAIAPFTDAPVRIENVANTRVKESDRLAACAQNLAALGIRVQTGPDWIQIWPGSPQGAPIVTHRDHRIAMAFSVTGLRVPGLVLDDPDCVAKTFPSFYQVLADFIARSD